MATTSKGKRCKIEIEFLTDELKRRVAFSKRRVGLFKKASELSELCGADIAVVTLSRMGKLFSFGNPNADTVINRFLSETPLSTEVQEICGNDKKRKADVGLGDEAALKKKTRMEYEFSWNLDFEKMGLEELERYVEYLNQVQEIVVKKQNSFHIIREDEEECVEDDFMNEIMLWSNLLD